MNAASSMMRHKTIAPENIINDTNGLNSLI